MHNIRDPVQPEIRKGGRAFELFFLVGDCFAVTAPLPPSRCFWQLLKVHLSGSRRRGALAVGSRGFLACGGLNASGLTLCTPGQI